MRCSRRAKARLSTLAHPASLFLLSHQRLVALSERRKRISFDVTERTPFACTDYHVDKQNHTGYAQVLEEM